MTDSILVTDKPFDPGTATAQLSSTSSANGALVTFTGMVRDLIDEPVSGLFLEHYPGMTERALQEIIDRARQRWALGDICIIHRVGRLESGEPIVFIGVSSAHRREAFQACEYLMDYLKTKAPFWKKEFTTEGERWVAAKTSDEEAARRW